LVDVDPFKDMKGGENVIILSDATFDEIAKKEKGMLVMFYAPCKITFF
jgi:hypothetical protein